MKLMRSMPGVPSATPAHENSACTGPPHSSTAVSIDALSERSSEIALAPASVTGARSMTTTSAPASCDELGDRGAHARRAAHDQNPLAVVPECIEE